MKSIASRKGGDIDGFRMDRGVERGEYSHLALESPVASGPGA